MNKRFYLIILSLSFLSCKQKKTEEAVKENNFEKRLFAKIDSFNCNQGIKRLLLVRHQKIENKDFIQIKVDYDFNLDSVAYCREKNAFSVFYNNEYFKNKINYNKAKKDSLLKEHEYYNNKYSGALLYHNICQEIYEVRNDDLILLRQNDPVFNKLFNYSSTYIPEPPPPPKDHK